MLVFLLIAALFPSRPHPEPLARSVYSRPAGDWTPPPAVVRLAFQRSAAAIWTWTANLNPPAVQEPVQGLSGPSVTPSVSYPAGSVQQIIVDVFGPNAARAIRIATCESGLRPSARNSSGASGVFQIMLPLHAAKFAAHFTVLADGSHVAWSSADWADPFKNATVAYDLSAGGTNWGAWVCR